jgi:hypothetical protein
MGHTHLFCSSFSVFTCFQLKHSPLCVSLDLFMRAGLLSLLLYTEE